ncbi:glycosyltransferase [Niallia sp. 03133]|uniref:glycosyltransferase n=1 Tax=Niallia sp. 03133 TaxID=3458060 RepID=UPI0040445D97
MSKRSLKVLLFICFLAITLFPLRMEAQGNPNEQKHCISSSEAGLKGDLRRLWIDHTVWTRKYIISALAGLDDQEKVLSRLLKNQEDLGNAIKPYYGEKAGTKLTVLLKEHIVLAGKLVDAAKQNNQAEINKYNKEWHRNADDIAKFLSDANPNWKLPVIKDLMYTHLKLVTDEVTGRLQKDWDADILAFDKGEDHIIMMADALADGIIKQFPDKFVNNRHGKMEKNHKH